MEAGVETVVESPSRESHRLDACRTERGIRIRGVKSAWPRLSHPAHSVGARNRFRIGSGILGTGVAPLVETGADQHALGTAVVSINRRQKTIDQRRRRLLGRAPILAAKLH